MVQQSKILFLDIETAPNIAYVWGLFDQNISPSQVSAVSYILCWAAKWQGKREMMFSSIYRTTKKHMLHQIWKLLDDADIVVHYNGNKFDVPTLNKEFVKLGFAPPSPFKQIDLLRVCRHTFRFESNKLDSITKSLDIGQKIKHQGFELWVGCMNRESKSWRIMERYNKMDVTLLEQVYHRLLPWITKHPLLASVGRLSCPKCNSVSTQRRGVMRTALGVYTRHQCQRCHGWFRSSKAVQRVSGERGVNIT